MAKSGEPALPQGFVEHGIPDLDLNAYFYFDVGRTVEIPATAFVPIEPVATGAVRPAPRVQRMEGVVRKVGIDQAMRLKMGDTTDASFVEELLNGAVNPVAWVDVSSENVGFGVSETRWSDALRATWANRQRASVESRYPAAWKVMQLLPGNPPRQPVAAGFLRNVTALSSELPTLRDVEVPGLWEALHYLHAKHIAFVVYADDLTALPASPTSDSIRQTRVGFIAVADANYPGILVNFLVGNFSGRLGFAEVAVADDRAQYRNLPGHLHLMLKNYGSALYFVVSGTREDAELLMESVIKEQQ